MNERIYYSREAAERAARERLLLVLLVTGMSVSIGTLIAMLFAPQSGEKTRQQIGEQMSQTFSRGRHVAENASEQFRENADKVRDNLSDRIEKATS
ncbi:MAG: hypothetical protein OHK0046_45490 [Anaerolineae bacterium]